jgi:hypothetical protein
MKRKRQSRQGKKEMEENERKGMGRSGKEWFDGKEKKEREVKERTEKNEKEGKRIKTLKEREVGEWKEEVYVKRGREKQGEKARRKERWEEIGREKVISGWGGVSFPMLRFSSITISLLVR